MSGKAHPAPVPPAGRSDKGPGASPRDAPEAAHAGSKPDERSRDLSKQGRQGDIAQNTHHQGHQQDR